MTEQQVQQQAMDVQLLAEARRTRQAVVGIQVLLTVWFVLALVGALVWVAYAL